MEDHRIMKRIRQRLQSYSAPQRKYELESCCRQKMKEKLSQRSEQPATVVLQESQGNVQDYKKIAKKELDKDKQPRARSEEPMIKRSISKISRKLFVKDEDSKESANETCTSKTLLVPTDAKVKKRIKIEHEPFRQSDRSVAERSQIQPAAQYNPATSGNVVEPFLAAIAPTLKSFPHYLLNVTKSKIFSIVQEAEIEFLKQPQQTRRL